MIWCQTLRDFQQRRDDHESSDNDERSAPAEADNRCGREVSEKVLDRPVAGAQLLPFGRQHQRSKDDQGQGHHAAKAYDPGNRGHGQQLVQNALGHA